MKGKKGSSPNKGTPANDMTPSDVYAGGSSNVVKEAKGRKHGGRAKGKNVDAHGSMARHRLDRPKRASGGGMSPFSMAHNVKTPAGRDVDAGES